MKSTSELKKLTYTNQIVIIGFGCLGQGILPLLFRHLDISPSQVTIVTNQLRHDQQEQDAIKAYNLKLIIEPLTIDNYKDILTPLLNPGDFLLNLSVEVATTALLTLAQQNGALYLDTCIEPWPGGYSAIGKELYECTNHALRHKAILENSRHKKALSPTAILCQGANPGLISQFVKQALLNIAKDNNLDITPPTTQIEWAKLAQRLNIKTIHIAERDTQQSSLPKDNDEFRNTWSVDGFVSEGVQPAELSFGTHEKKLPDDAYNTPTDKNIIYLNRPGLSTKVRTWTPILGAFHGYLITHNEAITLSEFLRITENNQTVYCPTVHYSYRPCDEAVASIEQVTFREYKQPKTTRVLKDEITEGVDELGVLLMGNQKGAYWYGSRLSTKEARELISYNTATSLQVVAGVLAGVIWAIKNPQRGIMEPEYLDLDEIMNVASPYLGKMFGEYTTWTPLSGRNETFPEKDLDWNDPWQFSNIRV